MPYRKCDHVIDGIECDDGYFYYEEFVKWPREYQGGEPIEVKEICPECNGEGRMWESDR